MDIEKKIELISASPTEEILTLEELRDLLKTNPHPKAYDGFEPSGLLHIASGLMRAIKLQEMLEAGCKFTLYVADWHGWINDKFGGDLEAIQKVGKYFIQGWYACGVDTSKVEVVWASDLVRDPSYWKTVIKIAKATTVKRMIRTGTIMGREEGEMTNTAQLFYPAMQAADIFHMGIDICQLGMDQRKVNVLARELAEPLGFKKPVVVHHHLLLGLQGTQKMDPTSAIEAKMSKSKPKTVITIHDSPEEIKEKIGSAYCKAKDVTTNPLIEICKYIIFKRGSLVIDRTEKYGGKITFERFEELEKTYREGELHPSDLKNGVAQRLTELLAPVREHFTKHKEARELYEFVAKGV